MGRLVALILQDGYGTNRVITVSTAQESLHALGLASGAPRPRRLPDLILLNLPLDPGGLHLLRQLKSARRCRDIPVLAVTANGGEGPLNEAFQIGLADVVQTPFSRAELSARVRSALGLKREVDRRRAREAELLKVTQALQAANQELERLILVDQVSGIVNRRRFDAALEIEWRRLRRHHRALALLMIDIDSFKPYNDTYGHQDGDRCLRSAAATVQAAVHRPGDLVARYGGDELVAILPNTTIEGARQVAATMRAAVESLTIPHRGSPVSPWVTISVGCAAIVPDPQISASHLIDRADQALYRAKATGRNQTSG